MSLITLPFRPRQLLLGALLITAPLLTSTALAGDSRSRLDVQAEAQLEVVPDRATLSARLWERTPAIARQDDIATDPEALREARDRLETRASELIQAMEAAGVARDAITAGSLNVQLEHLAAPRDDRGEREPMVRTRLERPFEIKVNDLEQLPVLLDALTTAGVNALDGVAYDLADREAATDEALVKALEKARHKAELMAGTLGVSLGPVLSVSETRSPVFQPRMMAMSADARESAPQVEYRPGTLSIEAGVSVSWEIDE
ncbi:SIMPL domain-containing protein [Halomonas campisalis]|uniref:SIMPL domain-containing protein n=1 Tax=Billgrantia campisalis TaxID=74661 RepID=A0ABS9PAH2_9GAMM|nr:SIMPL domain-containing protein [Halomonas campisalis]MCG6658763.1 SIMPL domain-containing protein [Halomonas campisalis]MDR5865011.1 SIMPL domain-containing protein [Halomonas campisalis]